MVGYLGFYFTKSSPGLGEYYDGAYRVDSTGDVYVRFYSIDDSYGRSSPELDDGYDYRYSKYVLKDGDVGRDDFTHSYG